MSLKDQFKARLTPLASGGPHRFAVQHGRRRLTCALRDVQPLACEVDSLVLATDELAGASIDDLDQISASLAARVNYLLEPIGPVERDLDQCVVQMRSIPPQQGEDGTCYYELLVRRGGELALCRYRKSPAAPRQRIPAVLTREVLTRLAGDFDEALD